QLQGSLRRKIEGHAPGQTPKQNGLSCAFTGTDFKRVRLDSGLGQGSCNHNLTQSQSLQGSSVMGMQRKNYMMPHGVGSDIFNMTLKEMKKEPIEVQSCGQSHGEMIFDFKDEGGGHIDPELQDLFDELTKSVPPLNDLEFEKMLKQDDTFGLDLGRPSSAGAAGSLCSPLDKPIKMEHSPDFSQVHCGSPQLRPASAGPSFTLTSTSPTASSQKTNAQPGHPRAMPCWPEISHAEQLKQMAANQQQPSSLLHHHHQTPPAGLTSWAPAMSTHSSTSSFPQDKVSNPASLNQQRIGSQNKGLNNCLFKSNGHSGSHHLDMKVLSIKPTLHFSPKAPHTASQPMPIMASSVNKTSSQQQQQSPSIAPLMLMLPTNGSLGVMSGQSQPRPPAPANQQKGPAKAQAMQGRINQQQHAINTKLSFVFSVKDKDSTHEQFSRHLTRPPPDYKQSRSMVGVQHGSIFTGNVLYHTIPTLFIKHFKNFTAGQRNSFGLNNVAGVQHPRTAAELPRPGLGGMMTNVNMGWGSANKQVTPVSRRLQSQLDMPNLPYQQRNICPPNQVAPDMGMLPLNPAIRDTGPRPSQPMMGSQSAMGNLNQASPEQRVPAGNFGEPSPSSSSYQSNRANRLTFDFLPEGDNTVPGINTDSDFIDSLLKSGSGNDDWMKDINLDEILGSHS
uniref:Mastermind-like transcriptional coactivator 2 n=1 Tax=Sphaeramia orbicularis TaxID=375764 RepID=A0A673AT01_9TELE